MGKGWESWGRVGWSSWDAEEDGRGFVARAVTLCWLARDCPFLVQSSQRSLYLCPVFVTRVPWSLNTWACMHEFVCVPCCRTFLALDNPSCSAFAEQVMAAYSAVKDAPMDHVFPLQALSVGKAPKGAPIYKWVL